MSTTNTNIYIFKVLIVLFPSVARLTSDLHFNRLPRVLQYIEQLKLWLWFHSYNSESLGERTLFFTSISRETSLPVHLFLKLHLCRFPTRLPNFFVIKPTRCTNFTNLFCHQTLHVSDSSSVHHQEFIHCTLSNGICHTSL
jgi:hypothetical protein